MNPRLVQACFALFVFGCGSSQKGTPSGSSPSDAGHGTPDATTPVVDSGGPSRCNDDAGANASGSVCILHISGRAIDQDSKPLASGSLVSACGPAQCNPGITNAAGDFRIDIGFHLVPSQYSVQVHLRPADAAFYYGIPKGETGPSIDIGTLRVLPMPASGPALNIDRKGTPAQSVTSGDVTLDVGDGIYVRLDPESTLAGDLGTEFRALKIPDTFLHEYAEPSLGIAALYALEPFESTFELPSAPNVPVNVRLSFANSAKLAAGSAVDLLALGSYVYPDWIPPATFQKVASGHVSADGATITLDPGQGLPYLTWVGVRSTP
jgi:hypothetical protein